ncbi:4-alpha-glucanotransferase [Leptospira ilyithenensis]|uniref:4-alpha-glucanotransferase n=1 Tax=Leptospira ilyithenensis TaxID=2484901 RepID=UPI0024827E83|nr:4-alpha-glucanotransferase [Leptospira ilyithenensis]
MLVPLSSILTKDSFECGDISSLFLLGKWARSAGFSILQILPLNDTGFGKSPYSSISAFAIDPIYISLKELGISMVSRKSKIVSNQVNQTRIRELKLVELRKFFLSAKEKNEKLANLFLSEHSWVEGYVCFRVLYARNEGKDWSFWPKEQKDPGKVKEQIFSDFKEEALFLSYLQYIAFIQLEKAKQSLEKIGVFLKGDMPILTSRNSADVWEHPEYFELDLQAGAPPDAFSDEGQNWGFPVLNWNVLRKTKFSWWKERLRYLDHFFHLYRIDHVIGMYRIWAIPIQQTSAKFGWFHPQIGCSRSHFLEKGLDVEDLIKRKLIYEFKKDSFVFYWDFWKESGWSELPEEIKAKAFPLSEINLKEDETLWAKSGEEILSALDGFASAVPCAEDLGAVPGFIRDSLKKRNTLGIDVIRWTRSLENGNYIEPEGYRKTAISVLSTHDTSLALDWWMNLSNGEKEYAQTFFFTDQKKELPASASEILEGLLDFSFSTNSLFSIQILQDLLFTGENAILENLSSHRFNLPGTPEDKNWSYRFSFYIEDLILDEKLTLALKEKMVRSHRFVE